MINKLIALFVLCLAVNSAVVAQEVNTSSASDARMLKVLAKGDKYYNAFAYKEAIRIYTAMEQYNFRKPYLLHQLANCYRLINDMPNAEKYYAAFIADNQYAADDVYYYSMALRVNGKESESNKWMTKYREMNEKDKRPDNFTNTKEKLNQLMLKGFNYRVKNAKMNSTYADFSPLILGNKVLFVSGRPNNLMIQYEFSWNETPYLDIYEVTVVSADSITAPTMIKGEVNTRFHDGPAVITTDGKTMYFTRNNFINQKKGMSKEGVMKLKLFSATLSNGQWVNQQDFPYNSDEYSVGHPAVSSDGKRLYFVSDMPGSIGGTDLWFCDKDTLGGWSRPNNLGPVINTEGNEMFPFISSTGDLFFASNGHFTMGGLDIFYAAAKGKDFKKPMNMGNVMNSTYDDFGFVIDSAYNRGYLSSNRIGGKGDDDIYEVTVLKPFGERYYVNGIVTDKRTGKPLVNAPVVIGLNGQTIELTTDENGFYEQQVEPGLRYDIGCKYEKYFPLQDTINTSELNDDNMTIKYDIALVKDEGYLLQALIQDKKTKEPIKNCKLSFFADKKDTLVALTDSTGTMFQELANAKPGDKISYVIKIDAPGYLAKEVRFTKVLEQPGIINLNEFLQVDLEKLLVGADLAKMIDIKPIYFDLNKYNIRKDAAIELDKIVKVMLEYPKMVVELGSHTDCRSSYQYNMTLSDNRAKASAAYIVSKGVETERIYGKGYGESKLVNDCACEMPKKSTCSEELHQQNRRTEFIIIKVE